MIRIRLKRVGRKNAPAYRIIVIDRKEKRDGRPLEVIGNYNPSEDTKKVTYKKDRYEYWISVGAQPSDAVKKLIAGKYKFIPYNHSLTKTSEASYNSRERTRTNAVSYDAKAKDKVDQSSSESTSTEQKKDESNK